MIVYVAASSSEKKRARWALDSVREAPQLTLSHHWLEHIEAVGSANRGISPEDAARYARMALGNVRRAFIFWLLIPQEPTFGAGVELGAFVTLRDRYPSRRIIASGPGRDVSIFVGEADHYFRDDALALVYLNREAEAVRGRRAGILKGAQAPDRFDPTKV